MAVLLEESKAGREGILRSARVLNQSCKRGERFILTQLQGPMRVQAFFFILYREFSCERGHLGLLLIRN
jgi:hypothetical protein